MITLDQIKKLDQKVQAAVSRISSLKQENAVLQQQLDEYQKRIGELEVLISDFKRDQSEIENGILMALEQLDKLEDSVDSSDGIDDNQPEEADVSGDEAASQAVSAAASATESAEVGAMPGEDSSGSAEENPTGNAEEPADQDESELDIF